MTVLLPNDGKFVTDVTKALNADTLASLRRNMEECIVDLKLPRFTTEMKLSLNKFLTRKAGSLPNRHRLTYSSTWRCDASYRHN